MSQEAEPVPPPLIFRPPSQRVMLVIVWGVCLGMWAMTLVLTYSDLQWIGFAFLPAFALPAALVQVLLARTGVALEGEHLVIRSGFGSRQVSVGEIEGFREATQGMPWLTSVYALLRDGSMVLLPTVGRAPLTGGRSGAERRLVALRQWLATSRGGRDG